ncbi:hypothetical protein TW81_10060 [Vibrio galatheae]|uniref:Uncharacterized protein n=1 Tax=Vibrio galatheae TaxID=579748 RepID=A0A0F4NKC2_9VIBR|nr:hypothetical protein [Vibrio galatheae]KJY83328.1 hypothetical protein TW81_10060 [Vibrio galatheae]
MRPYEERLSREHLQFELDYQRQETMRKKNIIDECVATFERVGQFPVAIAIAEIRSLDELRLLWLAITNRDDEGHTKVTKSAYLAEFGLSEDIQYLRMSYAIRRLRLPIYHNSSGELSAIALECHKDKPKSMQDLKNELSLSFRFNPDFIEQLDEIKELIGGKVKP